MSGLWPPQRTSPRPRGRGKRKILFVRVYMSQLQQLSNILKNRANYKGLTSSEADSRLKEFGLNARPAIKHKSWFKRFWDIFSEPMMLLIIAGSAIYFLMGDVHEAIILLCTIVPIGLMEFFQESRTDNAIKILDQMSTEVCQVYRDGELHKIESKYIVPGDVIYVTAGDKVPIDGCILNSPGLSVDESILTGESLSVIKGEVDEKGQLEEENIVWQGTMITQGEGYLLAEKTGLQTKYGRLGSLLQDITKVKTPLQLKMHKLIRQVAILAVIFAILVAVTMTFISGWQVGLLGGITIAMSLIPEEFPVVFSVFLIMGVLRLARQKALVREMMMVETLGSTSIICSDKTGTLTEGRMSLVEIFYQGSIFSALEIKKAKDDKFKEIFSAAALALEQLAVDPIEI